ncbi:MAG: NADH dehydrogenase (quinone) subunit D [Thermodesulfobacteriota bacterium]
MHEVASSSDTRVRETFELNVGPHHPSTHGVFRAVVELDGEIVVNVTPHLGYLHRGYEKTCEAKTWHNVIPLAERCDYMGATSNSFVYCLAAEKLLDIEVPERAQTIRVIMAELTRIFSHLFWLGTHAHDVGAMTPLFYCLRERESIMDLFELTAGGRLMPNYLRIGGLIRDLEDGFVERARAFTDQFDSRVDDYEGLLTKNPIYVDRTKNIGVLPQEDAIALGASGPMARASGVRWDIRKSEPYSGYDQYDFQMAVEQGCDVYSRYLVRIREMRESAKIVRQGLDKLKPGPIRATKPGAVFPPQEEIYTKTEALIHHFMLVVEGVRAPVGQVYQVIESPRGELGSYLVSDGGPRPYRLKWRPPAFVNLETLATMTKGAFLSDLIAILSSIDIVLAEVDR